MWEEIEDEHGRIYYWNIETDQVSWERPLKTKQKVLVKAETTIEEDRVKLRLIQCQPKDKIINRIWDQLSEKQKEMNELETIFRTNIVSKVFNTSVFCIVATFTEFFTFCFTFIDFLSLHLYYMLHFFRDYMAFPAA